MKYMMLIYDEEKTWGALSESEMKKTMDEYVQFTRDIQASGHHRASSQLQPSTTATSIRVRNGKRLVTDGPFAETREQLGGYYLVEAKDLDEAIQIAERIPSARFGTIEIRFLVERPATVTA
jgi:hypothetical protein